MLLYLHNNLKKYFSNQKPLFEQLMALRGECFRNQNGRITQRIQLGNENYFIKQHFGVGWGEIFKNLLHLRLPILGAKNEWRAIEKLQSLGVLVPEVMGYGEQGFNPAAKQSFILMKEIAPSVSLEDFSKTWKKQPPAFRLKRHLIEKVAKIARTLHLHGINHRDFYICHFLLNLNSDGSNINISHLHLSLIDLHRAQIRNATPERWIIKDLAGLYFSSKEIGLTKNDLYRFIKIYFQSDLKQQLKVNKTFWQKVKIRGERLYLDHTK